jgi:hypothetical protein
MRHDVALFAWMRWHIFRERARYWLRSLAGYDPQNRSLSSRFYLLYLIGFAAFWIFAMWAYGYDQATLIGDALSPDVRDGLARVIPWGILLAQITLMYRSASGTPLKLTHEDMAYVAGSPIRRGAVVLVNFIQSSLVVLLFAMPAAAWFGLVLGQGANAAGEAGLQAFIVALPVVILTLASTWAWGFVRFLELAARYRPVLRFVPVLALPLAILLPGVMLWPGDVLAQAMQAQTSALSLFGLAVVAVGLMVLLTRLGDCVDMVDIATESALFARIRALGLLAFTAQDVVRDIKRQQALAVRKPVFRLPRGAGMGTLIMRAALIYARRPRMLLGALLRSAATVPVGYRIATGRADVLMWAYFLMFFVVLFPPKSLVTVFSTDQAERFPRQFLPYDNLQLLLADALIPGIIMAVGSLGIWLIQPVSVEVQLAGIVLILCGIALFALCQAISLVQSSLMRVAYPWAGSITFALIVVMGTAFKTVYAAVGMAVVLVVVLGAWVRDG